ncbi:MAG: hypothetical protein DCC71_11785 [Proteobacteria bacterium]|nr:MAG: hypothetical protein DCC71_11785 [Pseudomonadota bacterium]
MHLYGWIPATDLEMRGDVLGGDFDRNYNKDLGDAFEDLDGGGGGDMQFRWKRLVGMIDGAWVQNDFNGDGYFTNSIIDGKLGVRVVNLERERTADYANPAPRFALDVLGGARYRRAEMDVDVNTPIGDVGIQKDRDWVDAVVGLGLTVGILPNLTLSAVGDYGGFDWGNSSHRTWSVNPRLTFRAWEHLDLFVGWKYLNDDHDGDLDMDLNGPQAGIGYAF